MGTDDGSIIAHAAAGVEPFAVPGPEAGRLCGGLSARGWRSLVARGAAPAPIRLGGRVVWRLDELRAWMAAGAPPRHVWERMRGEQRGGAR